MASSIKINFLAPAQSGDLLQIQDSNTLTTIINIFFDEFFAPLPITGDIDIDINNVRTYIENTYNATNRYIVAADYINKNVLITDNVGNSNFTELVNVTGGRLTTTIVNEPIYTPVSLKEITVIENATDKCAMVSLEIETFNQVTEITSPVIQPVITNPFTVIDIPRDSLNSILVSVNDGITSDADSVFAPLLFPSSFNVNVVSAPNGGSITINQDFSQTPDLTFQYSLDNVIFYDSNSFSGLSIGNYTAYIKDNAGCSTSIPFEITGFDPNVFDRIPSFDISQQNSLITVLRETINNETIFKNPLNTLSYEEDTQVNNRNFKQLFQTKDGVIKQQYKSNYDDVEIKLIDCGGTETILTSEKKSDNFDITDVRDVSILSVDYLGGSFVGVQYGVGNTYDPNTLVINGSYNLGTETPEFMNVDDYLQIEGAGWFRVVNISYYSGIETVVLDVLVNSFPIPVVGQTLKGTAIYNKLPYELYEFTFDCSVLSGDYYISYKVTDSEFDDINYCTEWFNVSDLQLNTYLLQYYNSENNETNYSTGITNKIRIPYITQLTYIPNDTQEVYLTDTNAVNIESTYRDFYSLDARPFPMGFIRKIGLALSNDRLFLNGLSLLKNTELETERIGVSNIYRLTVQFVRSDYAFTNISEDGSIVLPSGDVLGVNDNNQDVLGTKDNQ